MSSLCSFPHQSLSVHDVVERDVTLVTTFPIAVRLRAPTLPQTLELIKNILDSRLYTYICCIYGWVLSM